MVVSVEFVWEVGADIVLEPLFVIFEHANDELIYN